MTALSETAPLVRVLLKHARDAFGGPDQIDAEWRALGFKSAPDFGRALDEYERFEAAVTAMGAEALRLPPAPGVTLDSIYVRDASIPAPGGLILCEMGKAERMREPDAQRAAFSEWGIPILGSIRAPGRLEGGDVAWLDDRTMVVGRGYRTNDEGVRQLRALLGPGIEVVVAHLPHWRGSSDVFHLMSLLSPIDRDLALVFSPLLPVPFREWLLDRGLTLVEVPDDEFDSMGTNVLAIAPRRSVMVAGNPRTRERLERAGVEVVAYEGREISLKGGGGPTCLTRPIDRRG